MCGLQTCAICYKCCVITSVLGEQAHEPSPMVMMALDIVNGHDLMIGSPPSPMHHELSLHGPCLVELGEPTKPHAPRAE